MRVGGVVLAAGASTRLGEPKQLVLLGGERLLERAVRVAAEAGCQPLVVILGAVYGPEVVNCARNVDRVLVNELWREGMGSSLRLGVDSVKDEVEGVVVMACDQPAVTSEHLRALIDAGAGGSTVASGYAGRRGVPTFFPATRFAELLALGGDAGARELLGSARVVALAGGELDVDTPETLDEARRIFGRDGV